MASPTVLDQTDQALAQRFTTLVGRRPTTTELDRYRRTRSRATLRLPHRVRRGAARLVVRL